MMEGIHPSEWDAMWAEARIERAISEEEVPYDSPRFLKARERWETGLIPRSFRESDLFAEWDDIFADDEYAELETDETEAGESDDPPSDATAADGGTQELAAARERARHGCDQLAEHIEQQHDDEQRAAGDVTRQREQDATWQSEPSQRQA